jgi:polysaccharide biosynthesis protein PslH
MSEQRLIFDLDPRLLLLRERMNPLRIVLVLHEPPLPFGGAAARWFFVLVTELVERGHSVIVLAPYSRAEDIAATTTLFPPPKFDVRLFQSAADGGIAGKVASAISPYSFTFGPELRRELYREMARGADVLHLETTWAGYVGLAWSRRAVLNLHFLYGIDWSEERGGTLKTRLLRATSLIAERRLLRRYGRIATLTQRLTDRVRQVNPSAEVTTTPMALDLSLYPFVSPKQSGRLTVGMIGSFNWTPTFGAGVRLITRLWPEIRRRMPAARLLMVGRRARQALVRYVTVDGLTLIEDVPDAVPYFRELDVLLYAPPVGSGMKVKVMEAMALGTPVVSNSDGVEGLAVTDRREVRVADDDAGLIEATVELLRDPELRRSQADHARRLLERDHTPSVTVSRVEALYRSFAQGM